MIIASLIAISVTASTAFSVLPNPVAPSVKPTTKPPALKPLSGLPPEEKLVSLNVVDQSPAQVLQYLTKRTGANLLFIAPPDVKITTTLNDVRLIDVIRHLCALMNLKYLKVGSTFVLASEQKLKDFYPAEWRAANPELPEPIKPQIEQDIVIEVFQTNYVSASQIADVLKNIYDKGTLSVMAGPVQVNPSVVSQDAAGATGATTMVLNNQNQNQGGETTSLAGKTLVLRGERKLVQEALEVAKKLDTMRPQVAIQVTVHDISDGALKDLGVNWSFGNVTVSERDPSGVNFGSFDRTGLSFTAAIKALESQDKAKLMASPNVSVLDGERAFVLVGDRINFPVLVGFGQGNVPIFSKQEERVGIYMQVAASVSSDDQITMSLYPQISTISGFLEANGASYPQIATREAQTTIRVRSGETIVMGGLLKTEETDQIQKVPLLGDLPFLGELFRHRKTNKTTSQVIISITPKVIRA